MTSKSTLWLEKDGKDDSQAYQPSQEQLRLEQYALQLRESMDLPEIEGGVPCEGEPAIDPSRYFRPNQGDSEWIEDR